MKNVLDSIRTLVEFSQNRFRDKEAGKFLDQTITQDIYTIDLLLNGLLNYFQATTPIKKINTVNALIEEGLEKNKTQLEEKGVQLLRKLERNLPEIVVPDEQLKYIMNSILQYVIRSTPSNGNIEFLTNSFIFQRDMEGAQAFFEEYGGYVEISVVFAGDREPVGQSAAAFGRILTPRKDEALGLMLSLVKGIVLMNGGRMNFETDEKKRKTILSLRFPLERRKVVFYPPAQKTTDFARG
jgi:signal transduction histidine kinase